MVYTIIIMHIVDVIVVVNLKEADAGKFSHVLQFCSAFITRIRRWCFFFVVSFHLSLLMPGCHLSRNYLSKPVASSSPQPQRSDAKSSQRWAGAEVVKCSVALGGFCISGKV